MKEKFIVIIIALGAYQFFNRPANLSANEIDSSCDVVVFTTATCSYCKKAREFLDTQNIAWCEKDINKSASNNELFRKLGGKGVPFAIFGSTKINGFHLATYKEESKKI